MKIQILLAAIALAAGLGTLTIQAQHDEHSAAAAQAKSKMGGGMMGQMAEHKSEMMGGHREVAQLVDRLAQSFAAIQAEKNPAALTKALAEHGALLKELQTKIQAHGAMMEKMEKGEGAAPAAAPEGHKH